MISLYNKSVIQNTIQSRNEIVQLFLLTGNSLFLLPFFILLLSSVFFLIGQSITSSILFISLSITLLLIFIPYSPLGNLSRYRKKYQFSLFPVAIFGISIFVSGVIASIIFDSSFDGQWYHQYAVYNLAKGWNPIRDQIDNIYANHYSKGPWIYAALLYKVFNRIEVGKAFNIVFILGSFFTSLAALLSLEKLKIKYAVLISLIAAFNPVSIYQSLSFYVDGQLSSLLVTLTSLLFLFVSSKQPSKATFIAWLMLPIFVLLINIKFSGLVYSVAIIVIFALYLFVFLRKLFPKFFISSLAAISVGILLVGYNPYITNSLHHGHPFYPLAGQGSKDIMVTNTPNSLLNKNRFEKIFLSTFSDSTSDQKSNNHIDLKLPFTLKREELGNFIITDPRLAGFGPLFSGLVVLVLGTFVVAVKSDVPYRNSFLVGNTILLATVFINPECWWARYVPQLWLLPIFSMLLTQLYKDKIVKVLGNALILVALLNMGLVGAMYFKANLVSTIEMNSLLSELSRTKNEVILSQSVFISPQIRLAEHHINYKLVDEKNLSCKTPKFFPLTYKKNRFCLAEDPISRQTT